MVALTETQMVPQRDSDGDCDGAGKANRYGLTDGGPDGNSRRHQFEGDPDGVPTETADGCQRRFLTA
jgi:hypothetical protein